jgi:hypothetical protein
MSERQVVIYTSSDRASAVRLKEHLQQVGIEADVVGGGVRHAVVGAELPHGSTALEGRRSDGAAANVQVMVSESDQMVAQQIALEFGRPELHRGCVVVDVVVDARDQETIDAWPTCPQCGRKRHTMCPICETAGSDFPPADSISGDDETELEGTDDPGDPLGRRPLLCPMCDEPFIPNYLRECEWCNYDFGYGVDPPVKPDEAFEPANWRVAAVIMVLLGLAGLIIGYMNFAR